MEEGGGKDGKTMVIYSARGVDGQRIPENQFTIIRLPHNIGKGYIIMGIMSTDVTKIQDIVVKIAKKQHILGVES